MIIPKKPKVIKGNSQGLQTRIQQIATDNFWKIINHKIRNLGPVLCESNKIMNGDNLWKENVKSLDRESLEKNSMIIPHKKKTQESENN